jgi:hypothetical protein
MQCHAKSFPWRLSRSSGAHIGVAALHYLNKTHIWIRNIAANPQTIIATPTLNAVAGSIRIIPKSRQFFVRTLSAAATSI